MEEKTYAIYKDDGPFGVCGQSMEITRQRCDLHIFGCYKDFKDWAKKIESITGRKNARIDGFWVEGYLSNDIFSHIE